MAQIEFAKVPIRKGAASMSFDLVAKGGRTLATVWSASATPSEEAAFDNAESIWLALRSHRPMLAELKRLVAENYGQPGEVTVPALDPARAAIAAAEGTPAAQPAP